MGPFTNSASRSVEDDKVLLVLGNAEAIGITWSGRPAP